MSKSDAVGPVLQASAASEAVIAAIRELYPEAEVIDRGSYLRVLVPLRLQLARAAIEKHLGAPFRLPGDLELIMSSFKGRLSISEDEVVFELERRS